MNLINLLRFSFVLLCFSCFQNDPHKVNSQEHLFDKSATEIIDGLKAGNQRYLNGLTNTHPFKFEEEYGHAHSIILSCIDYRVVPELIFDQGLGNIYVARVAGNIEDVNVIASIEYAVYHGAKLLVVMGHSDCGAIKSAVSHSGFSHVNKLLEEIHHDYDTLLKDNSSFEAVTINNVFYTINDIVNNSCFISGAVKSGALKVVGCYYNVRTGRVAFLEEPENLNLWYFKDC